MFQNKAVHADIDDMDLLRRSWIIHLSRKMIPTERNGIDIDIDERHCVIETNADHSRRSLKVRGLELRYIELKLGLA